MTPEQQKQFKAEAEERYNGRFDTDDDDTNVKDAWIAARQYSVEQEGEGQVAALKKQLQQLEKWKESTLSVTPDMHEIAKLLNVGLGQSIHDKIIPGIKKLKERIQLAEDCIHSINVTTVFTDFDANEKLKMIEKEIRKYWSISLTQSVK